MNLISNFKYFRFEFLFVNFILNCKSFFNFKFKKSKEFFHKYLNELGFPKKLLKEHFC